MCGLGFFNRDHAFLANFFHRFSQHVADFCFAIGGNRTDLLDLFVGFDVLGTRLQIGNNGFNSLVDTALEVHRVTARGYSLDAFTDNRLRQYGRSRCAVAGIVVRLGGHFADQHRAQILARVLQLDFLRNRHAVFCCARRTE